MRSANNEDEEQNGYNIDIEFWGVAYLDLPDMFKWAYYIVASGCKVGKNNWLNENRVLNPSLEYDEIFATL